MSEVLEFVTECDCGGELEHFEPEPELGHLFSCWVCEDCEKEYTEDELYSY